MLENSRNNYVGISKSSVVKLNARLGMAGHEVIGLEDFEPQTTTPDEDLLTL